jgi:hypothetical protein
MGFPRHWLPLVVLLGTGLRMVELAGAPLAATRDRSDRGAIVLRTTAVDVRV